MSVQVAVRSRPLNRDELDCGASIIVRMNGSQVEVIDSSQGRGQKFCFDHAFWSTNAAVAGNKNSIATQETVFENLGLQTLNHLFTGYNACIFAYGQTGSGKTYSMMGGPGDDGLIPRIAHTIFEEAKHRQDDGAEVCVEVSFLEIYNERVRCLLNPVVENFQGDDKEQPEKDLHPLRVREHPVHGPYVEGLSKFVVSNKDEFLKLMIDGNRIRTTGATAMNSQSSRSHALFTVTVTQKKLNGSVFTTTKSKMNLVDLAGSERAGKTHATGARLQEGSNINKSLTSLGLVISTLAEEFECGKARHIPYRDSVLTWILKDNLGGNSKTVMLATLSPASAQYEETMSTLRYAERAKKIQNKAKINESNNNEVVAALQKEIEALRSQLKNAVDGDAKQRLTDELAVSEALKKDYDTSMEQKLNESKELMKEREAHMAELEAELTRQRNVIENLRNINTEKDKKISALLMQIADRESRTTNSNINDDIERLRLQIAELEIQRDEDEAKERQRRAEEVAKSKLRTEDLGNVGAKLSQDTQQGGKVSVRALAKAFENMGNSPQVVKKTVDVPEPKKLPQALQQAFAAKAAAAAKAGQDAPADDLDDDVDADVNLEDENVLECLEDDDAKKDEDDIQLDDDDVQLDDDDIKVDDEAKEDDIELDDDEHATSEKKNDDDIELDDDHDVKIDDDDDVKVDDDDDVQIDDDEPAAQPDLTSPQKQVKADDIKGEANTTPEEASGGSSIDPPRGGQDIEGPVTANASATKKVEARQRAQTVTASKHDKDKAAANVVAPASSVATLSIPSHALPNNRFLREPFKVTKIDEGALIGGKKERIWDVDFFAKKFANLDMSGYESFSQPSTNLFRVEKDTNNSKKLTMYFFDATHPYDLEFTSTDRRQRFFELAMLQRRNSIMWCPSLCPEGENDVILNIQGTTIDRPNGKVVKAKGDAKFMLARMPYEVIDLYYGCFSLQEKALPRSPAVLASFIPKTLHEVYVIGVSDVPKELVGNDEIANYLLSYLGASMYFVLANTAAEAKVRQTNNVVVVIVRRSFIVRVSHIEAQDIAPARKEGVTKTDFTGVGCALRINECSIGILLVNCNPSISDPGLRAGCIRGLMSNFPFGNTEVDIGCRFDYFICSGTFGFRDDFTDNDMLKKQMKAGNLMSDFVEGEPHASLISTPNPMRILASIKPRVCRLDIKQYQTSRAMSVPNAFMTCDVFCQRAFLSTFGEQVPRTHFILTKLSVLGHRIPHINGAEIKMSAEWLEGSPLIAPLTKQGDTYNVGGKNVPPLAPVVSNFDFLRLQTISFTVFGLLPASKEKKKLVIASAALPLKNSFSLGETVDFSVPMYYRGCNVGFLNGSILQVHAEKNDVDIATAGAVGERDAHVVSCYENQTLDAQGTWAAAMHTECGAHDWSSVNDPTVSARRESFQLPDPDKWKWLTQWRHEARADNVDGWAYAVDFKSSFEQRKSKAHLVRRRRWTRVMQAEDALTLHTYLESVHKEQKE